METTSSSSKLRVHTGDNGHIVASNDDLLIEILLRLPVVTIHEFKFVSKHWLSLITSPSFSLRRSQIPNLDPPSGFFFRQPKFYVRYNFVPLDIRVPVSKYPLKTTFAFVPKAASNFKILQSCNGLLVCCNRPHNFYVYNPSINWFKLLPKRHNPNRYSNVTMKISFDPTKSLHYKVVSAESINDDGCFDYSIQIQTYSSNTNNWSICGDRFAIDSFNDFGDGIYWNGAIHWLNSSDGSVHLKLDIVEHPTLTPIQTPITVDGKVNCHCKLFESRGCLLLIRSFYTCTQDFTIYEMRNQYSGWSVKYLIDLDDAVMLFPKPFKMPDRCICCGFWSIVLGEKEEDSFLVMELYGKLVQYKFVLKTLRTLCDIGSVSLTQSFNFIPSFAYV